LGWIYEEKGDLPRELKTRERYSRTQKLLLLSIILLTVVACRTLAEPSATPVTKF
jgi:hypothetical protein